MTCRNSIGWPGPNYSAVFLVILQRGRGRDLLHGFVTIHLRVVQCTQYIDTLIVPPVFLLMCGEARRLKGESKL